jgi:DNA polymerase-3 subunit gamma/tau
MKGDSATALAQLDTLHAVGVDPVMVLQDMLELTHFLTKARVNPELARDPALPEAERARGAELARSLSVPVLTRCWQMLLKGVGEVQQSTQPQLALEMVIIRLLYVSDQPTPGDVMKQLTDVSFAPAGAGAAAPNGGGAGQRRTRPIAQRRRRRHDGDPCRGGHARTGGCNLRHAAKL